MAQDGGKREVQQMADTAQAVENKKPKRGRKPADESRARILRSRLVVWKQTPESQRVSLRTLAIELRTSHQLLAFYLQGLDKWQMKEYRRRAEDIRERAVAENRSMTSLEESQVEALERAAYLCLLDSVLQPTLKRLEADSNAGTLSKRELMVVRFLAQRGVPIALKILQKHQNNLPARPTDRAKSFRMAQSESGNSAKMPSHAVS
jgi:hypothetical protein